MSSYYRVKSRLKKPLAHRDAIVCITRYICICAYICIRMHMYMQLSQNTGIYFKQPLQWMLRSTAAKSIRVEMYALLKNPWWEKSVKIYFRLLQLFQFVKLQTERTTWLAVFDKVERWMRASADVISDWDIIDCRITDDVNLF